jgi:hypothetical protein
MARRVLVQLILVVAIAAVVFFLFQRGDKEETLTGPFDALSAGDVQLMRWLGPDGERTLTRSLRGWTYLGTNASDSSWLRDRGNQRLADELLRNLDRIRAQRLLDPERLEDYGLLPPRRGLVLEMSGGLAETLWVGDATPVDRGRYATWRRLSPRAAVLDGFLMEKFVVRGDDNLRDPKLGRLALGPLDTAWVRTTRDSFAIIPGQEAWRVLSPAGLHLADSLPCKRAVNTLLRLQAIHFLHRFDHPSPSDLGLDPPRARWVLMRGTDRDTFLVGDRLVPEGRMYVQAVGRSPAQTLSDNWSHLVGDANSFRNHSLFGSDETQWDEIELVTSGGPLGRILRDGDLWIPQEGLPEIGGPDPLRLWSTRVANLARLRFIAYRDPPVEEPELLVVVKKPGGARDTLRIVTTVEGVLAQGPLQPGVWGKLAPQEISFWIRAARGASASGG